MSRGGGGADLVSPTPERLAGWVLLSFTLLALVFAWAHLPDETILKDVYPDTPWVIATRLHQGLGYTACASKYFPFCGEGNDRTAMREPVPVFLILAALRVHPSPMAGVVLDIGLYIAVLHVLYRSSRKEGRLHALSAAFLWLISLPVIQNIGIGGGQLAAALFLALGLWALREGRTSDRLRHWALAGASLGLAALSRTVVLAVAAGLVAGILLDGRRGNGRTRLRQVATLLVALCVVLSPWVIRNQAALGAPIFGSTLAGYNLYRHNFFVTKPEFVPHYVGSEEGRRAIRDLVARSSLRGTENEQQMQSFYQREAVRLIVAHPVRYLRLVAFRFLSLWFNVSVHAAYGEPHDYRDLILVGEQLFLLLAGIAGVVLLRRERWPQALGLLLACGAYMLVDAQARYLVELMPLIATLAASPALVRRAAGSAGPGTAPGIAAGADPKRPCPEPLNP